MPRIVTSTAVARRFLETANKADKPLTPLQLIKLSYLAHGWAYPLLGYLLVDEAVEAWKYGPVFPRLYKVLKKHGRNHVKEILQTSWEITLKERGVDLDLTNKEKELIDAVFESYKEYNGSQLITLTHKEGGPWSFFKNFLNSKMDPEEICSHYAALANERGEPRLA